MLHIIDPIEGSKVYVYSDVYRGELDFKWGFHGVTRAGELSKVNILGRGRNEYDKHIEKTIH